MNKDNNSFSFDDILAEFSASAPDEERRTQAAPDKAADKSGAADGDVYVDVSQLENYLSAHQSRRAAQDAEQSAQDAAAQDAPATPEENEEFSPAFTPSGQAYRRPASWAVPGSRASRTPLPNPDKYLNYTEKQRAAAIQQKEEAAQAKVEAQKSALRKKDRDAIRRSERIRDARERAETPLKSALSVLLSVLAVAALCWLAFCIHPGSGGSGAAMQNNLNLTRKLDVYANNAASDALSDIAYIKKIYTIAESDTVAPAPDPNGFGTTQSPAVIKSVIADAAELLDGQDTVWQEDLPFYPGADMYYYRDSTILVIVWKEIIEERCATLAEVKVADGSQFRRKLSEDSYGSAVYVNATTLASAANAVVASNADFYGWRQSGLTVYQRQLFRNSADKLDTCFVTAGGDMLFSRAGELGSDAAVEQYIADNDVLFSLSFGPVLVDKGELQQCESYPIGEVNQEYSRAGIGMTGDLHYLLMTVNHTDSRPRATVNEFARFMYTKGCIKAYNLDGGQTSEITILGKPVNYIDFGAERPVSDIIYFASALPESEVRR
ncbi:MAG: phosphodiester glycosidase family protein [Oscillospiraceae bacterium]|nr:phosphodiester glycosidase family protein [Oscillospiraceae bacterium]